MEQIQLFLVYSGRQQVGAFLSIKFYFNDLVLMNETMEDLKEMFRNSEEALKSKALKVSIRNTKVMESASEV